MLNRSLLNTGGNLLDEEEDSPTANPLEGRSVADVAPNQEQVEGSLATTKGPQVTPANPEVPMEEPEVPMEEPEVPMEEPEVEDPLSGMLGTREPSVDPIVDTGTNLVSYRDISSGVEDKPKVEAVSEETSSLSISDDPFADSMTGFEGAEPDLLYSPPPAVAEVPDGEDPFEDSESDVFKSDELITWESSVEGVKEFLYGADKLAYGAVKGLAGTADFFTSPGWMLAHSLADGQKQPFTSLLEQYYPEKNYQFEDDPDDWADDLLRMSQTGLEFASGGGMANVIAKGATKNAYKVKFTTDTGIGATSGLAYEGSLNMGSNEAVALLASMLAPSSKDIGKAFYHAAIKSPKATAKSALYVFDKTTSMLPFSGMVKKSVKGGVADAIQSQKNKLQSDPEAWTGNMFARKARKVILNTPDRQRSKEEQLQEISRINTWIQDAIPDSPEVKQQVERMKNLQDKINKEMGEAGNIQFTLEQIYGPVLKKNNMGDGLKELMTSVRLTNNDAYNEILKNNQDVMFRYLKENKGKLGAEETKAFTDIFENQIEELTVLQNKIYDLSNNDSLMSQIENSGYHTTEQVMSKDLRPAAQKIRDMVTKAYGAAMDLMPNDSQIDTTPVKNAVDEIYESLGVFSDKSNLPPYLREVVNALVKNADDGSVNNYEALKNQASKVAVDRSNVNKEIRELTNKHAKELELIDPKNTKEISRVKSLHADENLALQNKRSELLSLSKELETQKRSARNSIQGNGLEDLPEPNLVTVGDVAEGLRVVNSKIDDAYKSQNTDRAKILEKIKFGLEESMENLQDVDKDAYSLFVRTNSAYTEFMGRGVYSSALGDITAMDGHFYKLTSDEAVSKVWESGDTESIQRFLTNFDDTRDGLKNYLDKLDSLEVDSNGNPVPLEVKPIDVYSEQAKKGVQALKDMVYTSLARKINLIDKDPELDPANRLQKIKELIVTYADKHKSKLDQIPGLETLADDADVTIQKLSKYRQAAKIIEDQKNMGILSDIVGPGSTALRIMKDDSKAKEMYDFLNNQLPKAAVESLEDVKVGEAQANSIRKLMYDGFINEFTKNGEINVKGLEDALATGSSSRNNLSLVLGEAEVIKLDAIKELGRAMKEGDTKFTKVLMEDNILRTLENIGLPMGRIGSLLQRRAIFTPSSGYIAGAVGSKMLDSLGRKNTSRAMRLMVERPFDVLNIDQILLREMKDIKDPVKQGMLKRVMENPKKHMRELASWLPETMAKKIQAHSAYLGFEMTNQEATELVTEVLYYDPRHPELNPVLPKETKAKPKETPRTTVSNPKELPEETPEMFTEDDLTVMEANGEMTPDDITYLRGNGQVIPREPEENPEYQYDDLTMSKEALMLAPFVEKGITKEEALGILEGLGMADNANKDRMKAALEEVYTLKK